MSLRNKLLCMTLLPGLFLTGCSGGSSDDFSLGNGSGNFGSPPDNSSTDGGGSSGETESTTNISFLPLSVYEKSDAFGGEGSAGLFQGEWQYSEFPSPVHIINPIDTRTLASTSTAVVTDFKVTVDDIEIDPTESFPLLQKVIGNPVQLRTALVFDLTNSASEVDYTQLFLEAKDYVAAVKAHSNPVIANQEFVVWGFGHNDPLQVDVYETTAPGGFTTDQATINAAIDSLQARITAGINQGAPTNLHKAIVQVVGRYADSSATPPIDFGLDGNNDLVDRVSTNGIELSQMALFSSGPDTLGEFSSQLMTDAIQSQGFLQFNPDDPSLSTQTFSNKPVFYYVVGANTPGVAYSKISDDAETTRSLTLVNGEYNFSTQLIADQIAAINSRIDLDNQYIYRYAFLPRQGDHTAVLASRAENFNYTLTTQYTSALLAFYAGVGTPAFELSSLVEITGPNGEFLSANEASLSEVTTFRPATRWISTSYDPADDYTWLLINGTGVENADGSYTVNSIVGTSATLQLTNTVRGETASITIRN